MKSCSWHWLRLTKTNARQRSVHASKAVPVDADSVAAALRRQTWTFAKTMPTNPHEYVTRRVWKGPPLFDDVVQFIRDHGYRLKFGQRWYVCLDVDGWRHWTMGAPLPATVLINRARNA